MPAFTLLPMPRALHRRTPLERSSPNRLHAFEPAVTSEVLTKLETPRDMPMEFHGRIAVLKVSAEGTAYKNE